MNNSNNPAKRLHEILTKAKGFSGKTIDAWASVFDISDFNGQVDKQLETVSRIGQTYQLVNEVEEIIKNIEGLNHERYLRPFPRIRQIFPPSLDRYWQEHSNFMNYLTEGDMVVLEFCIDEIDKIHHEKIVDEEQLKEILSDISALYEQIRSSELEKTLKSLLLDLLETMRRTIHEYRIRGIERLKEGVAATLGTLILNQELFRNSQTEEVKKFGGLWKKFVAAYSFAADSVQMLEGVEKVLPLLPPFIDKLS